MGYGRSASERSIPDTVLSLGQGAELHLASGGSQNHYTNVYSRVGLREGVHCAQTFTCFFITLYIIRNTAYNVFGKEIVRTLQSVRLRRKWDDNIKMDFRKMDYENGRWETARLFTSSFEPSDPFTRTLGLFTCFIYTCICNISVCVVFIQINALPKTMRAQIDTSIAKKRLHSQLYKLY